MTSGIHDLIGEAIAALVAHRLRATLSIVGIVVGVATVVTAIAIGQGARDAAIAEIGALGIDNVFVRSIAPTPDGERKPAPAPVLTLSDARILAATAPDIVGWAATRTWRGPATGRQGPAPATLAGVTASWAAIGRPSLAAGRWFKETDARERRRVAVIGASLARRLFGTADPLGARVTMGGSWFVVVGRLAARARGTRSTLQPIDPDDTLFVPFESMDVSLGAGDQPDRVEEIGLALADADAVQRAVPVLPMVLRRRHIDPTRYDIVVPRELLNARLRAQRTFNTVLLAIGTLALVISGVGIMNIMLASVAERRQEIGVRRAFGARRREVIAQFALEAALLCAAGGLAGVPLGWVFAAAVAWLAGWPTAVSAASVALALVLATGVGLVFGVYPARVAASIDPAEALRAP